MQGPRRLIAVGVLVVALVAGAACTAPPEDTAESIGKGLGALLVWVIAEAFCNASPSCPGTVCMFAPCAPLPPSSTPPDAALPESVAPE